MIKDGIYHNDVDGWMRPLELNWLYQTARGMRSIVEIGSFKGRSTTALLDGCAGPVWSVDCFTEPTEAQLIATIGNRHNITLINGLSVEVSKRFKDKSVDMVFIDAGHTYDAAKSDIAAWLPKATKIICGHDYTKFNPLLRMGDGWCQWPEVEQAVDEIFSGRFELIDTIWAVRLSD